jgi:hypothetical protein
LTHDDHALSAIEAYADSCEADYPKLARDLRLKLGQWRMVRKLDEGGKLEEPDHE